MITEEDATDTGKVISGSANLPGLTKAYAPDALADGIIDEKDDDETGDCHLLHEVYEAKVDHMSIFPFRIGEHEVGVRMSSGVGPGVPGGNLCPVEWDFELTVDTSGPVPRWTLEGSHDGFPAYEIYINDVEIYLFPAGPPPYKFFSHVLPHLCRTRGRTGVEVEPRDGLLD